MVLQESIRRGHDDLGDHFLDCGDLGNALKCYSRARYSTYTLYSMYVCMYVCLYVCMSLYVYVYRCKSVSMYVNKHVYTPFDHMSGLD